MPYCEECGTSYKLGDKFCENCGFSLPQEIPKKKKEWLIVAIGCSFCILLIFFMAKGISFFQLTDDMNNLKEVEELHSYTEHEIRCFVFSSDGKYLITASDASALEVWDTDTFERINILAKAHEDKAVFVFSNGRYIASASTDKTVKLWNMRISERLSQERLRYTDDGYNIYSLTFSPSGKFMAVGDENKIKILRINFSRSILFKKDFFDYIKTLEGRSGEIGTLAFSPNDKYLASGSSSGTVKIWDMVSFGELASLDGGSDLLVFSPDGRFLARGGGSDIVMRDTTSFKSMGVLGFNSTVKSIAFSADSKFIAGVDWDGTIKIWNVYTFKEVKTLEGGRGVASIAFSPDGRYFVVSCNGSIKIWKINRKLRLMSLKKRSH